MSGAAPLHARGGSLSPLVWGRLLRLSLAPTAAADVLAGLVLAGSGTLPSVHLTALLVGASLCLYHGNLILNDWHDRGSDARERPTRPLPSGAIAPTAALAGAVLLCLAGLVLATLAGVRAASWMGAVGLTAVLYNVRARGARSGPLLLALCRAGNLAVGLFVLGVPLGRPWAAPVVYGAYLFCVARLGRLEDGADTDLRSGRPQRHLRLAALLLVAGGLALVSLPPAACELGAVALTLAAAAGLLHRARGDQVWSRGAVEGATGMALRRLLALTAAFALASEGPHGPIVAAAILAGYPLSWGLRGAFPPS
ncbi:MAG: hypothetical protein CMJ84_08380 [Planctomycetes bacterium]|jgi:4-hydroxybenzoate polyprenyltransferase|nr:hypothetical protein [Planctomycetota bacterium]MDP6410137.1 UbiA family prenyltransferase [Planctomycetota bacterium]